ncbi:MAG: hypB [Myxococcales bacterium]|nr:hypB [Myxococcales bacterium]
MCRVCGCDHQDHEHDHDNDHDHDHPHTHRVSLQSALLAKNDRLAEELRVHLGHQEIVALNLIGSPGAGKTTLLEHTIRALPSSISVSVVEGDQATDNDARRIAATGCRVVQINTGAGCHLDATMMDRGLGELSPARRSLVFIENVGNLVCPALFDLGERAKVVVLSVTEGEDKPLKYPHVFRAASVLVLTKSDLVPHLDVDISQYVANARRVNPALQVFPVSARRGDGLAEWCGWLRSQVGDLS